MILRDISQRKAAEEQIRAQAALLQHAREAIASSDLQGRILFWNRGAEQLYGWTAEEVIGRCIPTAEPLKRPTTRHCWRWHSPCSRIQCQ